MYIILSSSRDTAPTLCTLISHVKEKRCCFFQHKFSKTPERLSGRYSNITDKQGWKTQLLPLPLDTRFSEMGAVRHLIAVGCRQCRTGCAATVSAGDMASAHLKPSVELWVLQAWELHLTVWQHGKISSEQLPAPGWKARMGQFPRWLPSHMEPWGCSRSGLRATLKVCMGNTGSEHFVWNLERVRWWELKKEN